MARVPGVTTYTQYPSWAAGQWWYEGSVFDSSASGTPVARTAIASAVVSLGTAESYGFRRLVERLLPLLDGCRVTWQTGATDVSDMPIEGREQVPHDELLSAIAEADVVISHAGTGAALTALEQGRLPLLVPRRALHREHVDDHQQQIAAELSRRGLAVAREVQDVDRAALLEAGSGSATRLLAPLPFRLHDRAQPWALTEPGRRAGGVVEREVLRTANSRHGAAPLRTGTPAVRSRPDHPPLLAHDEEIHGTAAA